EVPAAGPKSAMVSIPFGLRCVVLFGFDPAPAHAWPTHVAHRQLMSPGMVVVNDTIGGQLVESDGGKRMHFVHGLPAGAAVLVLTPFVGLSSIGTVQIFWVAFPGPARDGVNAFWHALIG